MKAEENNTLAQVINLLLKHLFSQKYSIESLNYGSRNEFSRTRSYVRRYHTKAIKLNFQKPLTRIFLKKSSSIMIW